MKIKNKAGSGPLRMIENQRSLRGTLKFGKFGTYDEDKRGEGKTSSREEE